MTEAGLTQVDYVADRDGYSIESGPLPSDVGPQILEYEDLFTRIEEGHRRYMILLDASGCWHEMTIFNAGQPKRAMKPSTSYSGLLKNPANFLETAVLAALNPDTEFLFWTSFGNYPTGHLSKNDRLYQRQTGRYTKGNGTEEDPYRAIDAIKYLVELLEKQDLLPSHFVADQEAGRLALGIMSEVPEDHIKGVYLNAIDGLSHHAHYLKDDFVHDMQSRVRRRRIHDGEPGELTPVNIKAVKKAAPTIYHGPQQYLHLPPFVWLPGDLRDKISYERGRGKHKDLGNLPDHAVYHDMSAALARNETIITIRLNENGGQDVELCKRFGSAVMNNISYEQRSANRGVRFLIGPGSPTQNTDEPHKYARGVRRALGSPVERRRLMAALPGGRGVLSMSQVFELESVRPAA